jgi:glycosyltransferase involved in cell wall biosynthesis
MTNDGRQLRVALLTNFIPPYRLPVFRELARRVGSLRIFLSTTMEGDRLWKPEFGGLEVRVQRTYTRRSGGPREPPQEIKDTHFPLDTLAVLARFRPDVVISGELGFRTLSAALYCAMHPAAKLVIWATLSAESERHRGAFRRMIRRVLLHRADAVIVNGRSGRRYIERFGVPPPIVFEVPQTADVNGFARVPLVRSPEAARRLLYAGRLVSVKRVAPFLEVLARWARENSATAIEFWIAGTGPRRDAIAAVPCPPNLRVKFLGHIEYADLPRVYADAGVLVFPSDADEWGVVVNEAMASAMPVLGSSGAQAVSELVQDGVSGWVFPAGDAAKLLQKIGEVFRAGDDQLDRMRVRARDRALSITPERVVDRIEDAMRFARTA